MRRVLVSLMMCVAAGMVYAQQFTVSVSMKNMPEGAKVILCNEEHKMKVYAEGVVKDGAILLSGAIDSPALAELQINDKATYGENEFEHKRFVQFMLSDTVISISAPTFEDIPFTYEYGKQPIEKEMNSKVVGGALQLHYEQWRKESFAYRYAVYEVENELWRMKYGPDSRNRSAEQKAIDAEREPMLNAALAEKKKEYETFRDAFLTTHPTYAVSLSIIRSKLAKPFAYTESEIDAMVAMVKGNEDSVAYSSLLEEAAKAKHFLKNSAITDFKVESADGKVLSFKDIINGYAGKGYKTFMIDFWASWCGPCRASIPSVKKLHAAMKDQIVILSISVDRKAEDWKSAMEQEQMPWMQVRAFPSENSILTNAYNLTAIPTILIVSPDGRILFSTHDADEAHAKVHELTQN